MNYKILKISLLIGGFVLMVALVTVSLILAKDYDQKGDDLIYTISTISFPKNVKNITHPSYTPNNKIVFYYQDSNTNEYHIGITDDDGNNLHNIYDGEITTQPGSNGIRLMPFADNKRILFGDFVLETEPDFYIVLFLLLIFYFLLNIQMKLHKIVFLY